MAEQICTIVGMGPQLGMALARLFGQNGFRIAMISRTSDKLIGYVEELLAQGIDAYGFVGDAADETSLKAAFASIRDKVGNTSVLIYHAAGYAPGNASEIDTNALMDSLRVNVTGAVLSAQEVIPAMREAGNGTILLTGGGLGINPSPERSALSLGKAGLRNLAFSLHDELKPAGIHVATVTIAGVVKEGTGLDPNMIAMAYWQLHNQTPPEKWDPEIIYSAAQAG